MFERAAIEARVQPIVDALTGAYPGSFADVRVDAPGCGSPAGSIAWVSIQAVDEGTGRSDRYEQSIPYAAVSFSLSAEDHVIAPALSVSWPTTTAGPDYDFNGTAREYGSLTMADLVESLPTLLAQVEAQATDQRVLDAEINDPQHRSTYKVNFLAYRRGDAVEMTTPGGSHLATLYPAREDYGVTLGSDLAPFPIVVAAEQRAAVVETIGRRILTWTGQYALIEGNGPGREFLDRVLGSLSDAS